jgi:predicted metal-binding membrane protein
MTPEARQRRRIRTPVLAVTAVAWVVTLLADPLSSASGSGSGHGSVGGGPAPVPAALEHAGHAGHAHHAVMDAGMPTSSGNLAGLLIGWALMLTAMTAPLLIPVLRHAHARSLRSRRWRAVSLVTIAHAAVWTIGGIVLLALASVTRSVTGHADLALLLGLVAALGWQLSPLKQYCLNRHCAHPPISSFGGAADRDALRLGGTHATWCLGSCWALMLVALLAPVWPMAVMLLVSVWMWVEPLERPQRPTWRVRLPLRSLRIAGARLRSLSQRVTDALGRDRVTADLINAERDVAARSPLWPG